MVVNERGVYRLCVHVCTVCDACIRLSRVLVRFRYVCMCVCVMLLCTESFTNTAHVLFPPPHLIPYRITRANFLSSFFFFLLPLSLSSLSSFLSPLPYFLPLSSRVFINLLSFYRELGSTLRVLTKLFPYLFLLQCDAMICMLFFFLFRRIGGFIFFFFSRFSIEYRRSEEVEIVLLQRVQIRSNDRASSTHYWFLFFEPF